MSWLLTLPPSLVVGFFVLLGLSVLALGLGLIYGLNKNWLRQVPRAAWQKGVTNLLLVLVLMVATLGVGAPILSVVLGQSLENGLKLTLFGLIVGSAGWVGVATLLAPWQGGAVLLDIGPYPRRDLELLKAALWVFLGFLGSFRLLWIEPTQAYWVSVGLGLAGGVMYGIFAFSRLQARAKGLLVYGVLLRWETLENVQWVETPGKLPMLKFTRTGWWPLFLRQGMVLVPTAMQGPLATILRQYAPAGAGLDKTQG